MSGLKGLILDLDGTLVESPLDFPGIRSDLGLEPGAPILEAIAGYPPSRQAEMHKVLARHELKAAEAARPFPGAREMLEVLANLGLPAAVFTRNSRASAGIALVAAGLKVDLVVAREDAPPKPDPSGLLLIQETWQVPASALIYVGDFRFDLEAGRRAGIETWLFAPSDTPDFAADAAMVVRTFSELKSLLLERIPLN